MSSATHSRAREGDGRFAPQYALQALAGGGGGLAARGPLRLSHRPLSAACRPLCATRWSLCAACRPLRLSRRSLGPARRRSLCAARCWPLGASLPRRGRRCAHGASLPRRRVLCVHLVGHQQPALRRRARARGHAQHLLVRAHGAQAGGAAGGAGGAAALVCAVGAHPALRRPRSLRGLAHARQAPGAEGRGAAYAPRGREHRLLLGAQLRHADAAAP